MAAATMTTLKTVRSRVGIIDGASHVFANWSGPAEPKLVNMEVAGSRFRPYKFHLQVPMTYPSGFAFIVVGHHAGDAIDAESEYVMPKVRTKNNGLPSSKHILWAHKNSAAQAFATGVDQK